MKELNRQKRKGDKNGNKGSKQCDLCQKDVDLLIRCKHHMTPTPGKVWSMVCGKCWKDCSGGVTDGDINHPLYKYGGLWKNRS